MLPSIYEHAPLRLNCTDLGSWYMSHVPDQPKTMADIETVEILPPSFVVNRMARFPRKMIPWHFTWCKTLIISFNMGYSFSTYWGPHDPTDMVGEPYYSGWSGYETDSEDESEGENALYGEDESDPESDSEDESYSEYKSDSADHGRPQHGCNPHPNGAFNVIHSAVRMAFERMDRMIKDRTGNTITRRTWAKGERRPTKCEIDTFVLRWVDWEDADSIERLPIVQAPASALPSNHDRLWDIEFAFDSRGSFVEAVWRRRTLLDAQRDAKNDFMPLPGWLELPPRCE